MGITPNKNFSSFYLAYARLRFSEYNKITYKNNNFGEA